MTKMSEMVIACAETLRAAILTARDQAELREAFWRAVSSVDVKHVLAVQMRFCAEGKPSLSAILQTLPTAVTLEGLNARHENLAAAFDEVLEREHPFELSPSTIREFSPSLRAIFRDVFRQVRTPYCLAVPVRRGGVLRGGAFFMADEAFASQHLAFLCTLCEVGTIDLKRWVCSCPNSVR